MTTIYFENYRGSDIEIIDHGTDRGGYSLKIEGRSSRAPKGTADEIARRARRYVDTWKEDRGLLPTLVGLIDASRDGAGLRPSTPEDITEGSIAYVSAMGYLRRGLVIGTGRTRVTVAYTTASSNGRVFRKAVPAAQVLVAVVPA